MNDCVKLGHRLARLVVEQAEAGTRPRRAKPPKALPAYHPRYSPLCLAGPPPRPNRSKPRNRVAARKRIIRDRRRHHPTPRRPPGRRRDAPRRTHGPPRHTRIWKTRSTTAPIRGHHHRHCPRPRPGRPPPGIHPWKRRTPTTSRASPPRPPANPRDRADAAAPFTVAPKPAPRRVQSLRMHHQARHIRPRKTTLTPPFGNTAKQPTAMATTSPRPPITVSRRKASPAKSRNARIFGAICRPPRATNCTGRRGGSLPGSSRTSSPAARSSTT